MKKILVFISLFNVLQVYANCDKSGLSIIKSQKQKLQVTNEKETQEITLVDLVSNYKEKRKLVRYVSNKNGIEKSLLNFKEPKEVKGAALLSWDESGSKNQWLYLSSLKSLQRIASGSKKKYFMGSDFTFADLEGENLTDYKYQCLKEIKCAGKFTCYMVEATPISRKVSRNYGYKKRMLLIDKTKLLTLMINFYNLKGQKFKTLKNSKWRKIKNTYRPSLSVMSRKKHKTLIKSLNRDINSKIKPIIFSKRFLEKEMHMK